MNPANPNLAASVRARLLNVAKAQGVDFNQVLVVSVHGGYGHDRTRLAHVGVSRGRATRPGLF